MHNFLKVALTCRHNLMVLLCLLLPAMAPAKNKYQATDSQNQSVPAGLCSKSFSETIDPLNISGNHIYVSVNGLNFLKNPYGFALQNVEIQVSFKDHKKTRFEHLSLALNGLKISTPGGILAMISDKNSKLKGHDSAKFQLRKILMNSALPFHKHLLRLKNHRGLFKISVLGRHGKILDAQVTFKGILYTPCGTPPADPPKDPPPPPAEPPTDSPPPPPPVDPPPPPPEDLSLYDVRIDSMTPSSSPSASTNLVVSFSATNSDGSFWCSLDRAAFERCQTPFTAAGLKNGAHSFEVYGQTPNGVVAGSTKIISWSVDTVPPVASITNLDSLASITNKDAITFQFSSTKPGTFKCSLDGVVATVCESPKNYSNLGEGFHTFTVIAIDTLGNTSGAAAKFQWTIDRTDPSVSFNSIEPTEQVSRAAVKTFTFSADESANFECAGNDGIYLSCASPVSFSNLAEGLHWFRVRAHDLAGNTSSEISYNWTTDYTLPTVNIGAMNPAAGLANASAASVEFTTSELSSVYCQWDGSSYVPCASPFSAAFGFDGAHQLSLYAVDTAGNVGEIKTVAWNVDTAAPLISFARILPSSVAHVKVNNLSFDISSSEEATLVASLDGGESFAFVSPLRLNNLLEGAHQLEVSGYDAAGNLSNTIQHVFTVDVTPPVVTLTTNGGSLVNVDSRSFQFTANEESTYECSLDQAGYEACSGEKIYSGLANGDHNFNVRATDLAGNVSAVAGNTWVIDTVAPTSVLSANQNRDSISFSLTPDESGVTYFCSLDGQPAETCASPVLYSGLSQGKHLFKAYGVDAAGNVESPGVTYDFDVDTIAPVTTIVTSISGTVATFNLSASESVSGYLCSLDNAPFTSCGATISYDLSQGSHLFRAKATDLAGNVESPGPSVSFVIDTIAPAASGVSSTATTNSITVNWSLNKPATGKLNYGVGAALNQSSVTNAANTSHSIKVTGLSSNTLYSVQITGVDAAGNVYVHATFTIKTSR